LASFGHQKQAEHEAYHGNSDRVATYFELKPRFGATLSRAKPSEIRFAVPISSTGILANLISCSKIPRLEPADPALCDDKATEFAAGQTVLLTH
jgi:hypothetical protein